VAAGRVHLLYGLAGSGKTTLARALCAEGRAVRFTLDEWMISLYPGLSFEAAEYGRRTEIVKDLIWSVAEQVLRSGADVVLDWNSWSRARRAWAVQRAAVIPAEVILHRLDASVEQATASGAAVTRTRSTRMSSAAKATSTWPRSWSRPAKRKASASPPADG